MNKKEFTKAVAEKAGLKDREADAAIQAVIDVIIAELKEGNKVSLTGFGTFEAVSKPERQGRNPRSNEPMTIPASTSAKFKSLKGLKDALNA